MKKLLSFLLCLILVFAVCTGIFAAADETLPEQFVMREVERGDDEEAYYEALLEAERYNFKVIRNLSTVYEEAGWSAYCNKTETALKTIKSGSIGDKQKDKLNKMVEMRQALVEVKPIEEAVWMLWGESTVEFDVGG